MFEAQYLVTSLTAGQSAFSPWFPRQGDKIIYTVDIIQVIAGQLEVELFHKDSEDPGDGTDTTSAIGPTATLLRTSEEFDSGLNELVRYKFTLRATTGGTLSYVLFRMLPPVWFDTV